MSTCRKPRQTIVPLLAASSEEVTVYTVTIRSKLSTTGLGSALRCIILPQSEATICIGSESERPIEPNDIVDIPKMTPFELLGRVAMLVVAHPSLSGVDLERLEGPI